MSDKVLMSKRDMTPNDAMRWKLHVSWTSLILSSYACDLGEPWA